MDDAARVRRARVALAVPLLGVLCTACGPSPTVPSVADPWSGQWVGDAADSSGPGRLVLTLERQGDTVAGPVTITDGMAGVVGRGYLAGTVSAALLSFTIEIRLGGFDAPYGHCSALLTGTGRLGSRDIVATYEGTNSCTGVVAGGSVVLERS